MRRQLLSTIIFSLVILASMVGADLAYALPLKRTDSSAPMAVIPDSTSPLSAELELTSPGSKVAPNQALVVRFNQPMDPASSPTAFYAFPYQPGDITWNEDFTLLTFQPQGSLLPSTAYLFSLDVHLKSASGESFSQPPQWEVETLSAPQVLQHKPASLQTRSLTQPILVTFDRPMDRGSVVQAFSIQPFLESSLTWTDSKTLKIQILEALQPGERYRFSIKSNALDSDKIPLADDYVFEYGMPKFVVKATPSTGQPYRIIFLEFNYPISSASTGLPFSISPQIPGEWKWLNPNTAAFTANEDFSPTQEMKVEVTGDLIDLEGEAYPLPDEISFSPPSVVSFTLPEGPNRWENDCSRVVVNFRLPMDQSSTQAAFHLSPDAAGIFSWDRNSMIFTPNETLNANEITAQIGSGALDAQGNRVLVEPYVWTFNCYTSSYDRYARNHSFGVAGSMIQELDADGRRTVVFVNNIQQPTRLTFSLYALEVRQFVNRYTHEWFSDLPEDATKTWQITTTSDSGQEVTIPKDVAPGIYILKMSGPYSPDDFIFLILTRHSLMIKEGKSDVFAWASDINGASVPEMKIEIFAERGEKISQGVTDAQGFYKASISPAYSPLLVIGTSAEGEITVSGLDSNWSSDYCYYCFWEGSEGDSPALQAPSLPPLLIYTYTDRPIYQPGQMVYFKSILRQDQDARYNLLKTGTKVTVNLRDGRSNLVETQVLSLSELSTLDGHFTLAQGAMLGSYTIEVSVGGRKDSQAFKVQDYRKPELQVKVQAASPALVGEMVPVTVNAQYFFGQAAADAQVQVKVYDLYPNYWWGNESQIEDGEDPHSYYWGSASQTKKGTTDSTGNFSTSFPARSGDWNTFSTWEDSLSYTLYGIEATADNGSGQVVSGFSILRVNSASEKIGMDTGGFYHQPNEPFTVKAWARTLEGNPVSGRKLQLEAVRWYWKRGNEGEEQFVYLEATTGEDGIAEFPLSLPSQGYIILRLSSRDPQNNKMEYERYVGIFSTNNPAGYQSESDDLTITSGKERYRPSETARFVIESPFSGPALVTLERGSILRSLPVTLTAPLTEVSIPLTTADAPNVFVTIQAWRPQDSSLASLLAESESEYWLETTSESRLVSDRVEIQVDPSFRQLTIQVKPEKETYAPGEEAVFNILVTDAQGLPAKAEVSAALVDEAIFALSQELSEPIFSAFYGRRRLSVASYNSMAPNRVLIGDFGRGGGGGDGAGIQPRLNFPDTALWLPNLKTDAQGRVQVKVTLPDSLTTWRLSVKAVTMGSRVGEATANIQVQKELMVRLTLPESLVVSDKLNLQAFVHNDTAQAQTVTASLASAGLELHSPAEQVLTLAAGQKQMVIWPVTARQEGVTQVLVKIIPQDAGQPGDALQQPLEILPLSTRFSDRRQGSFQGQLALQFSIPQGTLPGSQVQISLNRTLAGDLVQGLEYLTGYPYGCVEQTMSKALPNAVVGRAFKQLGLALPAGLTGLNDQINAGLQALYGMQHEDGGWGWWYDDTTNDYQTAWVIYGLAITAEAGYPVDPQVIQRGVDWINEHLSEMDLRTQVYALYSLAVAGHGNLEATLAMLSRMSELDSFSLAALVLALDRLEDIPQAESALYALNERSIQQGERVYWQNAREDGEYYQKTMASSLRTTALALAAVVEMHPDDERLPAIVSYLMQKRTGEGWGSTNETAVAVLALTDYLIASQELAQDTEFSLSIDGTPVQEGVLKKSSPGMILTLPDHLTSGIHQLAITTPQSNRLYYGFSNLVLLARQALIKSGPVKMERSYSLSKSLEKQAFEAGQIVEVKLRVYFDQPASHIVLVDHLPAGLEALNENLNNTSHDSQLGYDEIFSYADYRYNRKEIRGSEVRFFATSLGAGWWEVRYRARALHTGSFTAIPTEVSAMYLPEIWGRTASAVIEIKKHQRMQK